MITIHKPPHLEGKPLSEIVASFNEAAEALYIAKRKTNAEFEITPMWQAASRNIVLWLIGSESGQWNPKKWLYIHGETGSRKTFLVMALNQFIYHNRFFYSKHDGPQHSFFLRFRTTKEMCECFTSEGYPALDTFYNCINLVIDDFGDEPRESNYYAVREQPAGLVIKNRCDNNMRTIITTNISPNAIAPIYGQRIESRLHESCNFIHMDDKDFRKINT